MTATARAHTAAAVIQAFAQVARPIILKYLSRRSCIASVRVAIECLKRFGVRGRPFAVRFVVEIPAMNLMYTSGLSDEEQERARKAKSFINLPGGEGGGWNGHLVIEAGGFLIDPSFDQAFAAFAETGHAMETPPMAVVFPLNGGRLGPDVQVDYEAALDNGTRLVIRYAVRPDDSFLDAPAWEFEYLMPVIREVCREMNERL